MEFTEAYLVKKVKDLEARLKSLEGTGIGTGLGQTLLGSGVPTANPGVTAATYYRFSGGVLLGVYFWNGSGWQPYIGS
jgi:hypothetical protein